MGLVNLEETTYARAEEYDPDRYATMQVDELQSPPVAARTSGAFGLGRHLCPGRRLACAMIGAASPNRCAAAISSRFAVRGDG